METYIYISCMFSETTHSIIWFLDFKWKSTFEEQGLSLFLVGFWSGIKKKLNLNRSKNDKKKNAVVRL